MDKCFPFSIKIFETFAVFSGMVNKTKDLVRYSESLSGLCHIYRKWEHRSLYTVDELF